MWKKSRLLLFFLCLCSCISAQLTVQDSAMLKELQPKINQIGNNKIIEESFTESIDLIAKKYISTNYTKGLAAFVKGRFSESNGKADEALNNYNIAQKYFEQCCTHTLEYVENDIRIGFISIHSGLINFDTLHFQKGYKYVLSGYERARKLNYTEVAQRMLDFMGDYHFYSAYRIQDFNQALALYEELEQELELEGKSDSTYRYIDSKLNLANVHRELKNTEESEKYFASAMSLSKKYNHHRITYGAYTDKAGDLENKGEYENALKLKLEAYKYAEKVPGKEILNRANRQLYYTYKNMGQYENALKYLELHFDGVREMNKAEALQLQAKLDSQKELDKQELEITSLENKNLSTSRNFLIALTILSLATLGFVFWAYFRLKQTNKKLTQKNEEIVLAQMKGQNIERKRMAGELHDNLNTKIAAVRYRLEAQSLNADEKQSKLLGGTINLINDIYEDIRLISHNLVPETVDEIGLIPSLEKLINSLNENDSTQFHLISKLTTERDLSEFSYELYNVIFEMINNILKHASAKNAWISISVNDGKLNATVKDDGKGFEVAENMGGFGLKSINSRIEKLNGSYQVESHVGKGTSYMIEIPI